MTERSPRIAVVGVPGRWSTEGLADALEARTGFRLVVDMAGVVSDLASGHVLFGEVDLCALDGLVIKKIGDDYGPDMLDRLEVLRFVSERGVAVFSKPERIARLVDRLSCTVTLRAAGIPMPRTLITEDLDHAAAAVRRFGAAILKPLFSTKARGMRLVEAEARDLAGSLHSFRDEGNPVLYVQERIAVPGRDLGVAFLGGEYLGTYARVRAAGAWSTTIREGGRYVRHDAPREIVELARRAARLFRLDFTSVDVAETADGPVVFEVSAFGGFRGLREALGLDAAGRYADYVLARIPSP